MLYHIELINTGTGQVVYNENLPYHNEPTEEGIKNFIELIRPDLNYDKVTFEYLKPYKDWN